MPDGMTIGAVLALLETDFPDVSISKIRFLESKGLVTPSRRPSGYRTYTTDDVERLRYILTAQRDWFWPLKVIRDALDAIDSGQTPPGPEAGTPAVLPPAADPVARSVAALAAAPDPAVRMTRAEVARATGLDIDTVDGLVTYGLLRPDAGGRLNADDLAVAHATAALSRYGVEPRHLRPFRTAADREVGLAEQVAAGARRRGEDDVAARVLATCVALHTALVRRGLHG